MNLFAKHTIRDLYVEYIKGLSRLNNEYTNNPMKKWVVQHNLNYTELMVTRGEGGGKMGQIGDRD